jgi:hypothetical protein
VLAPIDINFNATAHEMPCHTMVWGECNIVSSLHNLARPRVSLDNFLREGLRSSRGGLEGRQDGRRGRVSGFGMENILEVKAWTGVCVGNKSFPGVFMVSRFKWPVIGYNLCSGTVIGHAGKKYLGSGSLSLKMYLYFSYLCTVYRAFLRVLTRRCLQSTAIEQDKGLESLCQFGQLGPLSPIVCA